MEAQPGSAPNELDSLPWQGLGGSWQSGLDLTYIFSTLMTHHTSRDLSMLFPRPAETIGFFSIQL